MKRDSFHIQPTCLGAVVAVDARSTRSFARHTHDEFGVGVMTDGAQRSGSGRGSVEAVRGNIITVNPAELHDGALIGTARSWSMLYLPQNVVGTIVADLEEGRCSTRELHAPVVDDQGDATSILSVMPMSFPGGRGTASGRGCYGIYAVMPNGRS